MADIRRPVRPGAGAGGAPGFRAGDKRMQRWEAVFRRERRPVSLDRRTEDIVRCPILARGSCVFLPAVLKRSPFQ